MKVTRYLAVLPSIPGTDCVHTTREGAQREITTAQEAGYDTTSAEVREVTITRRAA